MALASAAKIRIPEFQRNILAWFDANARDLPWRRTAEPYSIWVSEIMLQQTRVAAVLDHYARFMGRFPSIIALALAPEDEVLALWSGLGYYRRAKLLHRAAQFIVREHQGSLPRTAEELRKLPGVGEYTAAAIASIAFGAQVAVIDGNVQRVIQRIFQPIEAITAQWARDHASLLLDRQQPGDFNQAMMELGATVCLPKNPRCPACPVKEFCLTRGEHEAGPRKQMRSREVAYALLCRNAGGARHVLLERRSESAAQMPGMWELPEISMGDGDDGRVELTLRHAITVTNYYVRVLSFAEKEGLRRLAPGGSERKWTKVSDLPRLPLTGLARKILRRLKIMPAEKIMV
ncbi:MAG TPA: A/G-specific adenine glycosylase [Acidobacteriaceae bacterium]|nr:A/G-specific adenine glycosylase [Acidobacteriaceae bacterium]